MKIYFQSKLTHYSAIYEAEVLIIANFSEKKKDHVRKILIDYGRATVKQIF